MNGTPTRTCAGCGGIFLTWAVIRDGDPYFCPECWTERTADFDPKPGDQVRDIDRMSGPFSDLFVVARDDDTVTVQPIGFPNLRRDIPANQVVRRGL